jgi:hypothetical protein
MEVPQDFPLDACGIESDLQITDARCGAIPSGEHCGNSDDEEIAQQD